MNRTSPQTIARILVVCLLCVAAGAAAQVTLAEYEEILREIPVTNREMALAALARGMAYDDFPAEPLMLLLNGVNTRLAPPEEKEALVLVLLQALHDDLPIQGLVSKGLEGLARGIPLPVIRTDLHGRRILLLETRAMLASQGIVAQRGNEMISSQTAIPPLRLRQMLIEVSEPIADFLAGGGDPTEDYLVLYMDVANRLTSLRGIKLPAEDVILVLERMTSQDLAAIAQSSIR
ncbi:MAG TPA: hypothetical protein ENN96_01935 [Candidatus Acetothermia bacterium]|nr:hypothetical protein [Candidatus Acetothermia bacterium]